MGLKRSLNQMILQPNNPTHPIQGSQRSQPAQAPPRIGEIPMLLGILTGHGAYPGNKNIIGTEQKKGLYSHQHTFIPG